MSEEMVLEIQPLLAQIDTYFEATRSSFNKVEKMVDCFAATSVSYDPVGGPALQGHEDLRQFFSAVSELFQEVGLTPTFVSINGDEAAVMWTGQGVGKNGRKVTFSGIDIFVFDADGKFQSMKAYWDPSKVLALLKE